MLTVPALGPLSLLREAAVCPPHTHTPRPPAQPSPFPSRGLRLWGPGCWCGRPTHSVRPWLGAGGGAASCCGCVLHARACTSTHPPPRVQAEAPSPPHTSRGAGRGTAPCAGLPAARGQCEVPQSRVGLPGAGHGALELGSCSPARGASPDPPSPGSAAVDGARGPSTKLSLALFFEEPE